MNSTSLSNMPNRSAKKRNKGITMMMDTGLSLEQVESLMDISKNYIDLVKFGWGTAYVMPQEYVKRKIKKYREAEIDSYLGGTLFEAYIIRNQFADFVELLKQMEINYVEVSDGSIEIEHEKKCDYIQQLSQKYNFTVLSEVGSKDIDKVMPPYKWVELIKKEIEAGAWKVIGEAREYGTVGLFRNSGEIRSGLVQEIINAIHSEDILWEAPNKHQQTWFIKLLGSEVNLGNIQFDDVISLETLRLGLRYDTFYQFLKN